MPLFRLGYTALPVAPAPGGMHAPVASVRAKQRSKGRELKPTGEQLTGVLVGRHEATDVGAPVRNTGKPCIDCNGNVRCQRFPTRLNIPGPQKSRKALHSGE